MQFVSVFPRRAALVVPLFASAAIASGALATVPAYSPAGSFTFANVGAGWDVRADGTLIGLAGGSSIIVQDGLHQSTATSIGSIAPGLVDAFSGASFLRLSPDGSRIALGDNGFTAAAKTYVFETAALSGSPINPNGFTLPNYDAAWDSNSRLYVAGGVFGSPAQLTRVDVPSVDSPTLTQVVSNVGGASGGIAIRAGSLYAGVGFDGFGSATGDIRSFSVAALNAAAGPTVFTAAPLLMNALSAASLDFDSFGNIIVGGFGSVGIINPATLERIDLAPAGGGEFYLARFNPQTNEIIINAFGSSTFHRFAVPGPGGVIVLGSTGAFAFARRRRSA